MKIYITEYDIHTYYDRKTKILYLRTGIGAWKIRRNRYDEYHLYHMNHYTPGMDFDRIMTAGFHDQRDVKPTVTLENLIRYLVEHDKAKQIIADDYRKLPQKTRRERKYYRQAKKREQIKSIQRVDRIFAKLEKKDLELKQHSIK